MQDDGVLSTSLNCPQRRLGRAALFAVFCLACLPFGVRAQTVTVVGWNANPTALTTSVRDPEGVAVDIWGNIYVADSGNQRVVEFAPSTTSTAGYQAGATLLSASTMGGNFDPTGVAVDGFTNVYIADAASGKVFELPWQGTGYGAPVAIFSGIVGLAGVAVDGTQDVYVADPGNHRLVEIPWNGTAYIAPIQIASTGPSSGIAIDSTESLYFTDTTGTQILKTTWTGTGFTTPAPVVSNVSNVQGIAVDGKRTLYFTSNEELFSAAWTGAAYGVPVQIGDNSTFRTPWGIALNTDGSLIVSDQSASTIFTATAPGSFGTQAVGTFGPTRQLTFRFEGAGTVGQFAVFSAAESPNYYSSPYDFVAGLSNYDNCPAGNVNAGFLCTVAVQFLPHHSGFLSGAVTLYDASGNALASIPVSGYGVGPDIAFNATQTSFPAPVGLGSFAFDGSNNLFAVGSGNLEEFVWNGSGFNAPVTIYAKVNQNQLGIDAGGSVYVVPIVAAFVANSVVKIPRTPGSSASPGGGFGPPVTVWTGSTFQDIYVQACGVSEGLIFLLPSTDESNAKGLVNEPCIAYPVLSGTTQAIIEMTVDRAGNLYIEADATGIIQNTSGFGQHPGSNNTQTDLGISILKIPAEYGGYGSPVIVSPSNIQAVFPPGRAAASLAVDSKGNLYLGAHNQDGGTVLEMFWSGSGFSSPIPILGNLNWGDFGFSMAFDSNDNLYVAEGDSVSNGGEVLRARSNGSTWTETTTALLPDQQLPGLAVDAAGNPWITTFSDDVYAAQGFLKLDVTSIPTINFPTSTFMGQTDTTDGSKSVTLFNIGNQLLALDPIYPAGFPVNQGDSNLCAAGASLAVGQSCDLSVNFAPAAAGTLTQSIATAGAVPPSTASPAIPVTGVGLSDLELVYGTAPKAALEAGGNAGSAVTVLVESLGSIITSANPAITLTVQGPNSYSATYTANATAGVATFNLSGIALTQPGAYSYVATSATYAAANAAETVVAAAVASLAFGTPPASQIVSGGNAGSAITVEELDAAGLVHTQAADTITLTVTGPGGYSATHTAQASAGIATFNLSGAPLTTSGSYTYQATSGALAPATAMETVSVSPVNFGSVSLGASSTALSVPVVFLIGADGLGTTVNVVTQGAAGGDFAIASGGSCSFSLTSSATYTAGSSCTLSVVFTPKAPGVRSGAVMVYSLTGILVAEQYISGVGLAPRAAFNGQHSTTVLSAASYAGDALGLAVDGSGNLIASNATDFSVLLAPWNGSSYTTPQLLGGLTHFTDDGNPAETIIWFNPAQVAVDGAGYAYVAEGGNPTYGGLPTVVKTPTLVNGVVPVATLYTEQTLGSGWINPSGIAVDASGNVYVSDLGNGNIYELPWISSGYAPQVVIATGINALQLAVDGNGNVFAAAGVNGVYEVSPTTGGFTAPVKIGSWNAVGIAVDGPGNLYVDDDNSGKVIRLPWTGSAFGAGTIVASPGTAGQLNGLAVDSAGNVYVSVPGNNTVVKVDTVDPPSLQFATPTPQGTTDPVDPAQTLTVYNTGNQALTFTHPASGANPVYPADFPANTADNNLCTSTTAPMARGGACDVSANLKPQALGALSETIVLTDNSANGATQSVAVTGTGVSDTPAVLFTGTQLSFNDQGFYGVPIGLSVDAAENVFVNSDGVEIDEYSPVQPGNSQSGYTLTNQFQYGTGFLSTGIAVDNSDNLYWGNNLNGPSMTVMENSNAIGNGFTFPAATALDPTQKHLYVADQAPNSGIWMQTAPFGLGSSFSKIIILGTATPTALAVDASGDVYVDVYLPDQSCQELKFTPSGGGSYTQTAIASYCSDGLAVASDGTVYLADFNGGQVIRQTPNGSGGWTTVAMVQGLNVPEGLALDAQGNLWIGDSNNSRVVEIVSGFPSFPATQLGSSSVLPVNLSAQPGTIIGSISILTKGQPGLDFKDAGSSTCALQLYLASTACVINVSFTPTAAGLREGELLVADSAGKTLFSVPLSGVGQGPQPVFNTGVLTQVASVTQQYSTFGGTAEDGGGNLYAAVTSQNEILYVPAGGSSSVLSLGSATADPNPGQGSISAALNAPSAVAVDGGGSLYIADTGNNRIVVRQPMPGSTTGQYYLYALATPGLTLNAPNGVTVDSLGNVDILDAGNGRVVQVTPAGQATILKNVNMDGAPIYAIALDGQNTVYLAGDGQVRRYGANPATLYNGNPQGLAIDAAGDIYIADYTTEAGIAVIPAGGTPQVMQLGSPGGYAFPSAISLDSAGNIFLSYSAIYEDIRARASLTYDTTIVNNMSADSPQTVQLFDAGNQPLSISSISYPTDFPVNSADSLLCANGTSLNPGKGCDISAGFTPTTTGPLGESIVIADNAPPGSQSVGVAGVSTASGQSQTLTLTPRVTCVCYPYSITGGYFYVGDSAGLPVTVRVLSGPMTFNGAQSTVINTILGQNTLAFFTESAAGSGVIEADQAGNSTYGPATPLRLSYTISPASLTFRLNRPPTATQVYGGLPQLTYTLTGLVNQGDKIQVYVASGVAAQSPVGTYTVTYGITGPAASSYTLSATAPQNGPLTVTPAPLTVNAVDAYQLTGVTPGPFSYSLVGLLNNDPPSVVSGSPAFSTSATSSSPAGSYALSVAAGTLTAANYTFTNFQSGEVSIFSPISMGQVNVGQSASNGYSYSIGPSSPVSQAHMFNAGDSTPLGVNSFQCVAASACSFGVTFKPTIPGVGKGTLILTDSTSPSDVYLSIPVTGTAIAPQAVFAPSATTALGSGLNGPSAVAVDTAGDVFIADTHNARVVELPAGGGAQTIVGTGWNLPVSLAVDFQGDIYVGDEGNQNVVEVRSQTAGGGQTVVAGGLGFVPYGLAADPSGNVYATGGAGGQVFKIPAGGGVPIPVGSGWSDPIGVAIDGSGNVFVADLGLKQLIELPAGGGTRQVLPIPGAISPSGVAVDAAGNLFIADSTHNDLVEIPADGAEPITLAAGIGSPSLVAIDGSGNLYLASYAGNQAIEISPTHPQALQFAAAPGATGAGSPQTMTVWNTGNAPMTFSALTYPADFPEASGVATDCSTATPLAAASSCTLTVTFLPSSSTASAQSTPLSESVNVTDNSLNGANVTQSIALTGELTQTITFAPPATAVYGAAPINLGNYASASSGLPVSFKWISGPGSITGNTLTITGAGPIVIEADQAGNGAYSAAASVQSTIVVSPVTLRVSAFNYSRIYGTAPPSTFAYSIAGFVNGDTQSVISGAPSINTSATSSSAPGAYPVVPSPGTLSAAGYTFQFVNGTLTISPALLKVTAYSYTRIYGTAPPGAFQYSITGFVNGDTSAVVAGSPSVTTTATSSSPVGTYPITPAVGTLSTANYTFQFANGTLTVAPAVLKVTGYNYSRYYRAPLPSSYSYSISGFVNGDTQSVIGGAPSITTTAVQGSPAGTYPIQLTPGTLTASNYTFTLVNGTLTITGQAVLTVTAYNYTRTYGTALPGAFQYTLSGFVGGDTASVVSGAPSITTTAVQGSPAGSYAISPALGTLTTSGNYTFAFVSGTLTIAPAVLKVTAYSYARIYGAPLPGTFAYSIAGFVNGDTQSVVGGAPSIASSAVQGSPVGSYPITPSPGSLTAANYSFAFAGGTLNITPAVLTVTAYNYTRAQGAALPNPYAYSIVGFANGDTQSVVSGTPNITTTAVQGSTAGKYPITPALGTLSAHNYSFAFVNGTLTITP